nr:MAG TPA: hypothetical protein [Bacteriophage sp.]
MFGIIKKGLARPAYRGSTPRLALNENKIKGNNLA